MKNRRMSARWQINWPSRVKLEGAECYSDCVVTDINFKGFKLTLPLKLPLDTFMKLNLVIYDDLCLDIEAWIVWHKATEKFHTYGLYFTRIRDNDKEKLYRFVFKNFPKQIRSQLWQGLRPEGGENMERENFEDRRIFERFEAAMPLRFIDLKNNHEGEANAQDISAKGIGFISKEEITPRTPVEMWLKIPDQGEPLYNRGEVVWSSMMEPNKYRVGVNLEKADLMGLSRVLRIAT